MAGDTYTRSVTIQRSQDDVWAALVTKSIVDTYYFLPVSDDITAAGQKIYYGTKDQQLITGKVLELQSPSVFKHSFRFAGEGQVASVVTYSLAALGDATNLTVTHDGYAADTQSYADIAGGWPIILDGIKSKLESN
ncbi:MAG: SRPBCC domain-containing protein [Hyphomicrobiales bacterium]|nr:SRPBCC domain-containing protein [Hyphomicrobiales bacterium]